MWAQKIEYIDADTESVPPPPVQKQVWDGEKFVPMTLYKFKGIPDPYQMSWLNVTYGFSGTYKNGQYWDFSRAGDFTIMDEQVYTWYQIKWSKK